NVLIGTSTDGSWEIVISDLGLTIDKNRAHSVAVKGTARYWSPEHEGGAACDSSQADDIWAFGVLIYELIYGGVPSSSSPGSAFLHELDNGLFKSINWKRLKPAEKQRYIKRFFPVLPVGAP